MRPSWWAWMSLGLMGCAPGIWDARQVPCDADTQEIGVGSSGAFPLWLYNTSLVDEDCEVKTVGIVGADFEIDEGVIGVQDVDEVDFEIDPAVFGFDGDFYPKLDVTWEEAVLEYDDDIGLLNRIDLSYGPSLPLLVLESDGPGRMGYGQDPGSVDSSSEPEPDEVRILCNTCYVNARVASSFRIRMEGELEADDRPCQQSDLTGDIGLCTTTQIANQAPIPTSVVCIEAEIEPRDEVVIDGGDGNIKVVVMPGADPARIQVVTNGTVAIYSPDLDYRGPVIDGALGTLPVGPLGEGPELDVNAGEFTGFFLREDFDELDNQCQIARRDVVTEGDVGDDDDDE